MSVPPLGYVHFIINMVSFREWTTRRPPKNAASMDPFLKPPRSTVSPSMSLLQGYYGLPPTPQENLTYEGTEMATYAQGKSASTIRLRYILLLAY